MDDTPSKKRKTPPQTTEELESEVHNLQQEDLLDSLKNLEALSGTFTCQVCERNISKSIRIYCAVCPNFTLCIECLATGQEKNDHIQSHSYHVVDKLAFPLFDKKWKASEELCLLQAIGKCGVDNWGDIAEFIHTKNKQECEDHYYTFYYRSVQDREPHPDDILLKQA